LLHLLELWVGNNKLKQVFLVVLLLETRGIGLRVYFNKRTLTWL
jgi:hypothetical protein